MNEEQKPLTLEQSYAILSAEYVERSIECRILRANLMRLEARVRELTPPPEGEKAPLEVVK